MFPAATFEKCLLLQAIPCAVELLLGAEKMRYVETPSLESTAWPSEEMIRIAYFRGASPTTP